MRIQLFSERVSKVVGLLGDLPGMSCGRPGASIILARVQHTTTWNNKQEKGKGIPTRMRNSLISALYTASLCVRQSVDASES